MHVAVKTEDVDASVSMNMDIDLVRLSDPPDDNDEDYGEVVREIDVYLSPDMMMMAAGSQHQQLHLLQYPLQQHSVPCPNAARIKPRHGILELDLPLPDSRVMERDGPFESSMEERTFCSQTIPVQTHLCLGKMLEKGPKSELHLVPLHRIYQMRPSFRHVDERSAAGAASSSTMSLAADILDDEHEVEALKNNQRKPVTFQRKESERAASARRSSYVFKKSSEDAEEWVSLTVQSLESDPKAAAARVECPSRHDTVVSAVAGDSAEYVKSLNYLPPPPKDQMDDFFFLASDDDTTLATTTDPRTIVARMTILLASGYPIPYSLLRRHFDTTYTDEALFSALAVCAVLVRGNFCLNSKFLSTTFSPAMQRTRTFLLLVLHLHGYVRRSFLARVSLPLSPERLAFLLSQVATKQQQASWSSSSSFTGGWVLKVEDNVRFCKEHGNQVELHNQYWDRQAKRFERELALYNETTTRIKSEDDEP